MMQESALSKENEEIKSLILIATNITERKKIAQTLKENNNCLQQAIEKLQKTQDKILQQERLHALGRMSSGIAHEFNNALSPIIGFSELLLMSPQNFENKEKSEEIFAVDTQIGTRCGRCSESPNHVLPI